MAAVTSAPSVSQAPLWQRALPHVLAVLFFVVLACVYFSPIVFDGKSLAQHDISQFQGGAHEAQEYAKATGKEALWNNSMFSGMPAYLISLHFSGDLTPYFQKIMTVGLPPVVANLFLALLCGYILLVALGVRPLVATVGAVALGFSSYNLAILLAGHNTKSYALAYAPLVLGGLLVTFRRNKYLGAALFTFGLAMNLRANHIQITYYLLLLVAIFGVVELVAAVRAGKLPAFAQRVALLAVGGMLALGVSFGRLYTTYEYSKYSNRSPSELKALPAAPGEAPAASAAQQDRDYAFAYSYGIGESMTLLVPNFYGGSSSMPLGPDSNLAKAGMPLENLAQMPTYWGDQSYVAGPVYLGVVVGFLFILGLFVVDKRTRYWLLAGTILSLLLAWGKNFETFNNLIFDYLPGYRSFRAVSMGLVIAQLAVPLLGALALSKVLRPTPTGPSMPTLPGAAPTAATDDLLRQILYAGAVTSGILGLTFVLSLGFDYVSQIDNSLLKSGWPTEVLKALRDDRAALLHNDIWRGLLFVGAALAVLYYHRKGKLGATLAAGLMVALVLIDLWGADRRYLNTDSFQRGTIAESFEPSPADQQILQDKDLSYRVLNLNNPFNEAQTSYFHKSIGGYHGAKLRRYQDLIERQISPQMQAIYAKSQPDASQVINMLNTRYLITPANEKQPAQAIRNPGALGNAWFVSEVKTVPNPDEEMAALSTLTPAIAAVVDASKFPEVKPAVYDPQGSTIALTAYTPDALTYRCNAVRPGFVVFSEVYYAAGWQAFLDGKPVPHLRANFVLRAMPVPAGAHTIEFKFEPKAYTVGNGVSLASSIGLLLVVAGAVVYGVRRKEA